MMEKIRISQVIRLQCSSRSKSRRRSSMTMKIILYMIRKGTQLSIRGEVDGAANEKPNRDSYLPKNATREVTKRKSCNG